MITCPNCGKENQDHYKFCLACGSKLPAGAPSAPPPGPPSGPPPAPPAAAPPAPEAAANLPCPSCEFVNPLGFKFCGRCGAGLGPPESVSDVGSANTIFVANAEDAEAASAPPRGTSPPPPGLTPGVGPSSGTVDRSSPMAGVVPPAASPGGTSPGTSPVPRPASDEPATAEAKVVPRAGPGGPPAAASRPPMGGPSQPSSAGAAAKLIMLGPDGQPIGERILAQGESLEVGRDCGQPWEDDAYLDLKHAKLTPTSGGVKINDGGSLNGIYLKLAERVEVHNGDQFRVGQELLLYEDLPEPTPTDDGTERMGSPNPGYWGRLSILIDPEHPAAAFPIGGEGIEIGREDGEIQFPDDGYVSGKHCRVFGDDDGVYIEDLGSSNGTYMRVRDGQTVPYGSLVLIGQKLFELRPA